MRAILLAAVLLSASAFVALAPTASACSVTKTCSVSKYGYCIEGTPPCYGGMLACATVNSQAVACAPDPCATANCFNANVDPLLPDGSVTTTGAGCVTEVGHSACVAPSEPRCIERVTLDGKVLACVIDPCGTMRC